MRGRFAAPSTFPEISMADLEPFNSKKHKPVDTVGGSKATEYLASENAPEGKGYFWNIPTIWFDSATGKPTYLKGDAAWDQALDYEKKTGQKFPRFKDKDAAINAAKERSSAGGASKRSLINSGNTK
jgi:hypothetical protein